MSKKSDFRWIGRCSALIIAFSLFLISGCGDETSGPVLTDVPEITGAVVPETVEEGSEVVIEIWGRSPDPSWVLDRFEIGADDEGLVTITPIGRIDPASGESIGETFRGTARFVASSTSMQTIRIRGSNRDMDYPIHVFPRGSIVRMLVRGGPDRIHEELVIGPEWAMAFRRGETRAVRILIDREQIRSIRGLFTEARFFTLEDRYIGERPTDGLFIDLLYRDGDRTKQILAEDEVAPESLRRLVGNLRRFLNQVLEFSADPPAIHGVVTVEPVHGEPTEERTIRLTLVNRSDETQRLDFANGQKYDIVVFLSGRPDNVPPDWDGDRNIPEDGPDRLIWNWAFERDFTQAEEHLVLEPRGEQSFTVVWSCVMNGGATVGEGTYQVLGIVTGRPHVPVRPAEVVIGPEPPPPPPRLNLSLSIEPPVGRPGSPRDLIFVVENPGTEPVTLFYPDNQHYDFRITDPMSMQPMPIWSWSYGKGFTDFPTELRIEAGESLVFIEQWGGRANDGSLVGTGIYVADAILTARRLVGAPAVRFEITR